MQANKEVPAWVLFLASRSINCPTRFAFLTVMVSLLPLYQGCWNPDHDPAVFSVLLSKAAKEASYLAGPKTQLDFGP